MDCSDKEDGKGIIVLGSLLYDTVFWADHLPRKGETVVGFKSGNFAGGKGANQAVQIAKLGVPVSMIGRMGLDLQGDFIEKSLISSGVDTGNILRNDDYPTGDDAIHVDGNGDNAIVICPHANIHIDIPQIDKAFEDIENTELFVTQFETNTDAVAHALKFAKNKGMTTILNPAPAVDVSPEIFRYADYVTPNETEAEYLTGILRADYALDDWIEKCCKWFTEKGAGNVIITLGREGAVFYSFGEKFMMPSFTIKAVDTTAAGDSFNAGFACSLLWGKCRKDAVAYGCACGALTAGKAGAQEALPQREEVEEFISMNS